MTNPWILASPKKSFVVGVSDMVACNDSNAELITHSLGSCVGISIYDPAKRVGGLLHIMLPDSTIDSGKAARAPFMFADTGLPRFFHAVYSIGGEKTRLQVKIAGGAQILDEQQIFNIGLRNAKAVLDILAGAGVTPSAKDLGGSVSRTLRLDLTSGKVSVKSPNKDLYWL